MSRQHLSDSVNEKLQKVLARAGLGSRREMENAIEQGRVKVNHKPARLGDRVSVTDTVLFDGRKIAIEAPLKQRCRVLLYNKPEGEICTRSDPQGRPTVYDRLPPLKIGRWICVGRLDFNTSGLLLFTNNGELANKLMHPASVIDREYLVRIQGRVDEPMKQRLLAGVLLEDGMARFSDIVERDDDSDTDQKRNRWFYCVVMEGRNREVRRLWESQGVKVSRLKRVRYGNIFIPSHVRVGQWIELDDRELGELCQTAGIELPSSQVPLSRAEKQYQARQQRRLRAGRGKAVRPRR